MKVWLIPSQRQRSNSAQRFTNHAAQSITNKIIRSHCHSSTPHATPPTNTPTPSTQMKVSANESPKTPTKANPYKITSHENHPPSYKSSKSDPSIANSKAGE